VTNLKIKIVQTKGDKMLCIKIVTSNGTNEGNTTTRELNELFKSLLDDKQKEIRMGKYSDKISDIISIQVFEKRETSQIPLSQLMR
jgi:hypothetical protein